MSEKKLRLCRQKANEKLKFGGKMIEKFGKVW